MRNWDVCITGGGLIGLSIALELDRRGARVTVVERGKVLSEASQAAAGMLAAEDPENPGELADLARFSVSCYEQFLRSVEGLSGLAVPFQTGLTYQAVEGFAGAVLPAGMSAGGSTFQRLEERSIDPRQLAAALETAVRASGIRLMEGTAVRSVSESSGGVVVETAEEATSAGMVVLAMGAWSVAPVRPLKGQMLAVRMPGGAGIDYVVRTPEIYMVPRLHGPRAGQVVIGATVEDAGFSKETDAASLDALRRRAAEYLPALREAEAVEQWAGLRPDTPDHLPLLGWLGESRRQMVATGHYRNGILLAPGTAAVVANLLEGAAAEVDLGAFSPGRFA